MSLYYQIHSHFGHLTVPLLFCSLTTVALLIEKTVALTIESLKKQSVLNSPAIFRGRLNHKNQPLLIAKGLSLLFIHRRDPKLLREEVADIWLHTQRKKLSSGIRMLQVIALLSPLLGLLGTVLGLIQVFDNLADHRGPIEPSLLADGLGLAMHTTAAGLVIALPALAGAHGFQIWIDKIIHRVEYSMNQMNLLLDGVDMTDSIDRVNNMTRLNSIDKLHNVKMERAYD